VIVLKNNNDIAEMREAGRIVARVHEAMREMVRPGVTTYELDAGREIIPAHEPSQPFGYPPAGQNDYPATICAWSKALVHGIPVERWLELGDIISIDVSAICRWVGDSA
jgi:methionyl aminopeptidase